MIGLGADPARRSRPRQDADHSVSTTQTPQRVDFLVSDGVIDVVESVAILAGEIAGAIRCVRRDDRIPAEGAGVVLRALELVGFL
jgi:hypothetical protein